MHNKVVALIPFSVSSPVGLTVALILALVAVLVTWRRRLKFLAGTLWLAGSGVILLCLACGRPSWNRPVTGDVAVMIDLSPSTRGAFYRNRALLESRIAELLGHQRYRLLAFGPGKPQPLPEGQTFADMPAERTVLEPPVGAAAIVLFSDGRLTPSGIGAPIYPVVDPGLESPSDGRISSLEIRGNQAVIEHSLMRGPRRLTLAGTEGDSTVTAVRGDLLVARNVAPGAARVSAQLSPGDLWPENDQLEAIPPPPAGAQRWWIGSSATAPAWRIMNAGQLPKDPLAYLAPAIIVLQNIAASDLSELQQQRLLQYVRDLGGTLLILGGDRAFAAGGYPGSVLESLSPLSSTPPEPVNHWLLLVDGSGSMATAEGNMSRWQLATNAVSRLIPHLPPDDLLDVGSFAETLGWWSTRRSVRQTAAQQLPPASAFPHGPTNLQEALRAIEQSIDGSMPRQLLLVTDADVKIGDPAQLATALKQKNIRVFLLAIGPGSGLPALQILTAATGGTVVQQLDPAKWATGILQLLRAASPRLLVDDPIDVRIDVAGRSISLSRISPWNRTWRKATALTLAQSAADGHSEILGGRWNIGEGRVAALALDAPAEVLEPLIKSLERPPRDRRFAVSWQTGSRLQLNVQALDADRYLNGEDLSLEISAGVDGEQPAASQHVLQVGPGAYSLAIDSPRAPSYATLRNGSVVLDRIAVAGRYPPEFDAVGNDREALDRLARLSGGRVITPDQHLPIDLRFPVRRIDVTSIIAILGSACVGLALARWNWG